LFLIGFRESAISLLSNETDAGGSWIPYTKLNRQWIKRNKPASPAGGRKDPSSLGGP